VRNLVLSEIIFWILIFLIGAGSVGLMTKGKMKMPTFYKIKVTVLKPGCNIHADIKPKKLPHKIKIKIPIENGEEEKEYTVKIEDLWKIKYTFLKRPLYWLMGIKGLYLCLFRYSGEGEAIETSETKATPILIRNVQKSTVLGKALAEMFKARFSGIGRFAIIILVVGAILFIAYTRGMIG